MPYTNPFFSSTTGYSIEVKVWLMIWLSNKLECMVLIYFTDARHMLNLDKLLHESSKVAFEIEIPI